MFSRVLIGLVIALVLVGWSAAAAVEAPEEGHGAVAGHGVPEYPPPPVDMNPLTWRSDLAIWTAAVFLVLLLVLRKFAWGPIAQGLEKREQGIADQIDQAERSNAEARQLLAQYQQKLAASQEEIRQMLQSARHEAQKAGQQIVDKARADAQAEHQRMLGEIELATLHALKELAERSATLAVELAGKIVEAKLDPKAHAGLIERAVADFSRAVPGNN